MRSITLCILFCTITSTQSLRAENPQQNYFSSDIVGSIVKKNGSDIMLETYAIVLSKMHEPSIYQQCKNQQLETYRFLYSPALREPFSVTVTHKKNDTKIYFDSKKSISSDKTITPFTSGKLDASSDDWTKIKAIINGIDFFKLPIVTNRLGADGENWVLEGCQSGKYHLVDRWSPEPKGEDEWLIQLGELFVRLAKLDIEIRPFNVD